MTPHLDDGRIAELLDGEVPSRDLDAILAHLAGCPACAARLADAQAMAAEADDLVTVLDHPGAAMQATVVAAPRASGRQWLRRTAWAASLAVAAGAGYLARGPFNVGSPSATDSVLGPGTATNLGEPESRAAAGEDSVTPSAARGQATVATVTTQPVESRSVTAEPPARQVAPTTPPPTPARDESAERLDLSRERVAESAAAPAHGAAGLAQPAPANLVPRDQRIVAGSRDSLAAARRADVPSNDALEVAKAARTTDTISVAEAVRRLGGSLRLIDGSIPDRVETAGTEVHVVYRTPLGDIRLAQRRVDGRLVWRLVAPDGFPADSLAAYRRRVGD